MEQQAYIPPKASIAPSMQEALLAWEAFGFFRPMLEDETIGLARQLCQVLYGLPRCEAGKASAQSLYWNLFERLVGYSELSRSPVVGDAWQNYFLDRMLSVETSFSKKAQYGDAGLGAAMREGLALELANLQTLFRLSADWWQAQAQAACPCPAPVWKEVRPLAEETDSLLQKARWEMKKAFACCSDWREMAPELARYHHRFGSGCFAQFLAFRWEGQLTGVTRPDPIRLEELVGYGRQRAEVIENTERLLAGYRANNVLLYGDRGTGKSSTVKALIHRFGDQGLRLLEVPKSRLADFPVIVDMLKERPQKFILFIDDLSFEEGEDSYKELKAVLEGGIAVRPDNVAIYATSNRRHLIREVVADRQPHCTDDGELRPGDTYQEKMSLADRFGITVTFLAPGQEAYLEIVETLARQQGIEMDSEELRRLALRWEMRHNGRSGRTARQFIDSLAQEKK
ncbi:ATP-binding protein [Heliomicrobium modesticaldum]|nr:ATP-binding protein [Heliomicrobium modesticaldum]